MRILFLFLILFFGLITDSHALNLSRVKTWSAQEVLTAADLNSEFNNILNHSLTNNDIDAAAGIVGSKLDLSSPGIIGATTPAAATYTTLTINSTSIFKDKMSFTQTDNLEYIDSLADGYLDLEATTGLRFRINATEQVNLTDGVLAPTTDDDIDLGSTTKEFKDLWIDGTANIDSLVADTADINAGTMDGVQIGGTTATGELIVNDASDDADGLGSQGTSGQYLQSAGVGVNPTFVTPLGILLSTTSFSAAANSGAITITAGKRYMVFLAVEDISVDTTVQLRFDEDSANVYAWSNDEITHTTTPTNTLTGDDIDSYISMGDFNRVGGDGNGGGLQCHLILDATAVDYLNSDKDAIMVSGTCIGFEAGGVGMTRDIGGVYKDASTLSSLMFLASAGTFTGTVVLYELN